MNSNTTNRRTLGVQHLQQLVDFNLMYHETPILFYTRFKWSILIDICKRNVQNQHGFNNGKPTVANPTECKSDVSNGMFAHKRVHAIYIDHLWPGNEDVDKGHVALFIHKWRIMGSNSPNTELNSWANSMGEKNLWKLM